MTPQWPSTQLYFLGFALCTLGGLIYSCYNYAFPLLISFCLSVKRPSFIRIKCCTLFPSPVFQYVFLTLFDPQSLDNCLGSTYRHRARSKERIVQARGRPTNNPFSCVEKASVRHRPRNPTTTTRPFLDDPRRCRNTFPTAQCDH